MALFGVFDIAASAMSAQALRLNLVSSNLANADALSSSTGETYRTRYPVFASALDEAAMRRGETGGVEVRGVVQSDAPLRREYRPGHPAADEQGYVYRPNVNIIKQVADMISASRGFQTNVDVVNVSKQMLLRTLSMGQ